MKNLAVLILLVGTLCAMAKPPQTKSAATNIYPSSSGFSGSYGGTATFGGAQITNSLNVFSTNPIVTSFNAWMIDSLVRGTFTRKEYPPEESYTNTSAALVLFGGGTYTLRHASFNDGNPIAQSTNGLAGPWYGAGGEEDTDWKEAPTISQITYTPFTKLVFGVDSNGLAKVMSLSNSAPMRFDASEFYFRASTNENGKIRGGSLSFEPSRGWEVAGNYSLMFRPGITDNPGLGIGFNNGLLLSGSRNIMPDGVRYGSGVALSLVGESTDSFSGEVWLAGRSSDASRFGQWSENGRNLFGPALQIVYQGMYDMSGAETNNQWGDGWAWAKDEAFYWLGNPRNGDVYFSFAAQDHANMTRQTLWYPSTHSGSPKCSYGNYEYVTNHGGLRALEIITSNRRPFSTVFYTTNGTETLTITDKLRGDGSGLTNLQASSVAVEIESYVGVLTNTFSLNKASSTNIMVTNHSGGTAQFYFHVNAKPGLACTFQQSGVPSFLEKMEGSARGWGHIYTPILANGDVVTIRLSDAESASPANNVLTVGYRKF